jgi:PAS domain S-box-containing protein
MAELVSTTGGRRVAEVEELRAQLAQARAQVEKLGTTLHEQEALSRRVERARQAWAQTVDALSQPIFLHDETGGIVRANRAYARRAGAPVKNLIGKVYWKLFPLQDAPFAVPDSGDQTEFEFALSPEEVFLVRSVGPSSGLPPGWRLYIFQDVSELKRAEAAVVAAGLYARSIVDSSLAMIVAVDRDRRVVEFNPAAERAFGYTREEMMGRHIDMLYADPESGEIVRRLVFERQGMLGEIENKRKNGEVFTSLMSAAVLRDPEGKALGILGTSLDVTERKRAETRLREALGESESIIDNVATGIAVAKDRVFERVNRRFAELLGYRIEELVGKSTEIIYPAKEDYERVGREAYPEIAKGDIYQTAAQFKRKDGSLFWAHLAGRALDGDKGAGRSVWVFEDISERRGAEEQLRRREAHFRSLIENGNEAVIVTNAEGSIKYDSPGIERVLGYRPAGRSSLDLVHPDDAAKLREACQRVLRGAAHQFKAEFRMRHRDGTWRVIEGVGSGAFDFNGDMVGVLNLQDVTERRRGEQRLLQSMQSAIAAITAAAEARDPHRAGHQRNVAALAVAIAREMGLDETRVHGLHLAGIVHDVGNIQIPVEILTKGSQLSPVEYALVKTHPLAGHEILKNIELPWPVAQIVLQHHELFDGSGYPRGLKGDQIMVEARILTVADVVEAMVSNRPHRLAHGIDGALAEITKNRGVKYDPQAVDACVKLFREKGYAFEKR